MYVNDLLEQSGQVRRFQYFLEHLHIQTHLLEYCGIITAVPWRFKSVLQEIENIQEINTIKLQQTMFLSSSMYYSSLLSPMQFHSRWLESLNSEAQAFEPFEVLHQCTIDRKLRNFQFKLLYKILPTNSLLEKMHVKPNDRCNFCKEEKDSLLHIYWECKSLEFFWTNVNDLLEILLKEDFTDLSLDKETIILGYCGKESWGNLTNFLILFAKYFIHCCYWTDRQPSFDAFYTKLKYYHNIELDIAIANNQIEKYIKKYKLLNVIF
jgi:hypothetical protein